jgi:glutamate N-acetyltransferase/amino-acid N-acetyltransferase
MRTIEETYGIQVEETGASTEYDQFLFPTTSGELVKIENDLSHQPAGITSLAKAFGIKYENVKDFTVIRLSKPWTAAAVYTRNMCPSDAVKYDRKVTEAGEVELICVISKNANVFAPQSAENIEKIADALSKEFGVKRCAILISCTGIIGVPLPMEKILPPIVNLSKDLQPQALEEASKAILTTDRKEKCASFKLGDVVTCGFVKGAGMIEPKMATMLGYLFTNAAIEKTVLDGILKRAIAVSLNSISVDTDTSTSDTVAIVASGEVPLSAEQLKDFEAGLAAMLVKLGRDIVAQAEGASKVIEVTVASNLSKEDTHAIAKKVVNSPLMKAAVYGNDPNWGRIVMAIGKPDSDNLPFPEIKREDVEIEIQNERIFDRGDVHGEVVQHVFESMSRSHTVSIKVTINEAVNTARVWGCDLTEEYVRINAEYST